MIKKGDLKKGDLVFNRDTRKYGKVTDVECMLRPRGWIEVVEIQYEDDDDKLILGYGDFALSIDKVELATGIDYNAVKRYVDEASATCCQIESRDLTEEFRTLMKELTGEKEKEKVKTEFTIKKINSVDKIIFNAPATIVYMKDGSRYVTKAYKEDFDKEKGLALALLKAFGISYLDLQRLIKSAVVQEKKAPKKVNVADVTVDGQSILGQKEFTTIVEEKPKKKSAGRQEETVDVTNSEGITYTIHRGKRRGVGQKLQQGDAVLLRLCKVYDWEEMDVVRKLIGQPLVVDYVGENSIRVVLPSQGTHERTYEFSRNEVDRI